MRYFYSFTFETILKTSEITGAKDDKTSKIRNVRC